MRINVTFHSFIDYYFMEFFSDFRCIIPRKQHKLFRVEYACPFRNKQRTIFRETDLCLNFTRQYNSRSPISRMKTAFQIRNFPNKNNLPSMFRGFVDYKREFSEKVNNHPIITSAEVGLESSITQPMTVCCLPSSSKIRPSVVASARCLFNHGIFPRFMRSLNKLPSIQILALLPSFPYESSNKNRHNWGDIKAAKCVLAIILMFMRVRDGGKRFEGQYIGEKRR